MLLSSRVVSAATLPVIVSRLIWGSRFEFAIKMPQKRHDRVLMLAGRGEEFEVDIFTNSGVSLKQF